MGKPHLAVRIPPALLAELNSYVEQVGTSRTDVVVSAIALSRIKIIPNFYSDARIYR
jgi:hypothetical protein